MKPERAATGAGQCIAILGMGRSGTSALAGALQLLGVELGRNLIAAGELNSKGYFENAAVVALNRSLLRAAGSYDGDFRPIDDDVWDLPAAARHRAPIADVLDREFRDAPVFALKDPRLCRVWPIWQEAIEASGRRIGYILPLRHPVEVVQSLHRLGTSTNHGLLWWLANTLDAEQHSRDRLRVVVPYEAMLLNPAAVLENISKSLGLAWPVYTSSTGEALGSFVDSSMRHFSASAPEITMEADAVILRLACAVHTNLLTLSFAAAMDQYREEFAAMARSLAGWRYRTA